VILIRPTFKHNCNGLGYTVWVWTDGWRFVW